MAAPVRPADLRTRAEVAAFLRCSIRTVRRLEKAGKLRAVRVGRRSLYAPADLVALGVPRDALA